jgi:DNA transposition AAA+ family ATPase
MIIRTLLPTMKTKSYAEVMGTIKMGIERKKLTAVFGPPGSGKSSLLNDVEIEYPNAHYILCAPTMTMKNLLVQIANSISIHVKGDTYSVQKQLTDALASDPNHILLFDECEYLHHGNVNKIDVLRQIYDCSKVPMILCGTYQLQNVLSGANDHNQPQIFRRLFKAEFKPVSKEEFTQYLDELEKLVVIRFTADVRNELFALCTDMENGGLGIFIYLLENMLLFVRPEWEDICLAHKNGADIDTGGLTTAIIDRSMLRQSSRFQMKK